MDIPLRRAPAIFFDEQQWKEFSAFFPTDEIALIRISRPPSLTGYFDSEDSSLPQQNEPGWETIEISLRLGHALIGEFKRQLISNELIAFGSAIPFGDRVQIDAEFWKSLWPNFVEDCALGAGFGFSAVQLRRNESRQARKAERAARLTNWLRKRAAEGERAKKILQVEAQDYFGSEFRSRDFDKAYQSVFNSPRGRPRKQNKST